MSKRMNLTQCLSTCPSQLFFPRTLCRLLTTSNSPTNPEKDQKVSSQPSVQPASEKAILNFPFEELSYHWDTLPPTPAQLTHASKFFSLHPTKFLWSAAKFKTIEYATSPEICILGRSNVGKSSLLNTLLQKKIAYTSSKPGRTKLMNAFTVHDNGEGNLQNRLIVVDMPGYGKGGREEWGKEILKYLEKRESLKCVFVLLDGSHGIKKSDEAIFEWLREKAVPFQVVLSKVDRILFEGSKRFPEKGGERFLTLKNELEKVKEAIMPQSEEEGGPVGEIIACSSQKTVDGERLGIDALRFAILRAAGLEYQPKVKHVEREEVVSFEEIEKTMKGG